MTKQELLHTRFCQEALSFGAAGISRPGREGKRYSFAVFSTGVGLVYRISLDDDLLQGKMTYSPTSDFMELKEMQSMHAVLSKALSFFFLMNTIMEQEKRDES